MVLYHLQTVEPPVMPSMNVILSGERPLEQGRDPDPQFNFDALQSRCYYTTRDAFRVSLCLSRVCGAYVLLDCPCYSRELVSWGMWKPPNQWFYFSRYIGFVPPEISMCKSLSDTYRIKSSQKYSIWFRKQNCCSCSRLQKSVAVLAEISFRSPQKLFILILKQKVYIESRIPPKNRMEKNCSRTLNSLPARGKLLPTLISDFTSKIIQNMFWENLTLY